MAMNDQGKNDGQQNKAKINQLWRMMGAQGGAKAHEEAKQKPVVIGNARLPEGIEGGIAILRKCSLGVFQSGDYTGKLFFRASGAVRHPREHNGFPIYGLNTVFGPIPLCQLKKGMDGKPGATFEDQYAKMMNQIKLLMGEESANAIDYDDLPAVLEALEKANIYFTFRTWRGKKQTTGPYKDKEPRTVEEWNGQINWQEGESLPDEMNDETGGSIPENGNEESTSEGTAEFNEFQDTSSTSTSDTAAATATVESGDESEGEETEVEHEEEEEEESSPYQVGKVCKYRPLGADKKPGKPVDCEILAVDESKQVVTLLNIKTQKKIGNVPFTKLELPKKE